MSEEKQVRFDQLGATGMPRIQSRPGLNIEENEKLLIPKALMTNRGNVTQGGRRPGD